MGFHRISDAFKNEHPLPEGCEWRDESLGSWPGIFRRHARIPQAAWVYFTGRWEKTGKEAWEPKTFTEFKFDPEVKFDTAEEALHYGYTLFMLGYLQE